MSASAADWDAYCDQEDEARGLWEDEQYDRHHQEPEPTVVELIELATGLNGQTLLDTLQEFGLDIVRTPEVEIPA